MTAAPMRPDEPRRRTEPAPEPHDPRRRLNALWALALRRFRAHLNTIDEDTDGRTE
jgi:hypothetical protein